MTNWTTDELSNIGSADELLLSSLKEDGMHRRPVTIWVVRVGDDLYVRSYLGRGSVWFRKTQLRNAGRISAGGITKDVKFEDVSGDETLGKEIDKAYWSKYRSHGDTYVGPMVAAQAHAATLKLIPS